MSQGKSFIYALGRAVCRVAARISGTRVLGRENLPQGEALLIICNHTSLGDPPLLTAAYPGRVTYLAKDEFRRQPLTRVLFRAMGAVFIKRGEGDLAALRAAINELKAGRTVAIFPEGTRHRDQRLGQFHPGAAFIAAQAQVRVLPMAVVNSRHLFRPGSRDVLTLVGAPLDPPPPKTDRAAQAEWTQSCRAQVARLFQQGCQQLRQEGFLPPDATQSDD